MATQTTSRADRDFFTDNGLGYSSASLTVNIYAHVMAANDRTAANTIGNTVFGSDNSDSQD